MRYANPFFFLRPIRIPLLPPFLTFTLTKLSKCISLKGKAIPLQIWAGPWESRSFRLPGFSDSRHMTVVKLSALYSLGKIADTQF